MVYSTGSRWRKVRKDGQGRGPGLRRLLLLSESEVTGMPFAILKGLGRSHWHARVTSWQKAAVFYRRRVCGKFRRRPDDGISYLEMVRNSAAD